MGYRAGYNVTGPNVTIDNLTIDTFDANGSYAERKPAYDAGGNLAYNGRYHYAYDGLHPRLAKRITHCGHWASSGQPVVRREAPGTAGPGPPGATARPEAQEQGKGQEQLDRMSPEWTRRTTDSDCGGGGK